MKKIKFITNTLETDLITMIRACFYYHTSHLRETMISCPKNKLYQKQKRLDKMTKIEGMVTRQIKGLALKSHLIEHDLEMKDMIALYGYDMKITPKGNIYLKKSREIEIPDVVDLTEKEG